MQTSRIIAGAGFLLAATGLVIGTTGAATAKEPPACQAISFRPLVPGGPNADLEAGMTQGRKVILMGTMRDGVPVDYYMVLNNQRPTTLLTSIAKGSEPCLKAKHVAVPVKAQTGACTGDRFRVVIYKSGSEKTAMLFGLHGDTWEFCNAAKM